MKVFGMNLFTYLRGLFSGHIGYWAETNDAVLNEIAARIRELGNGSELFFRHFLLATNNVAEVLVGYQHGWRILDINLKQLSVDHFRGLYSLVLTYFVVVCCGLNPHLAQILQGNVSKIVGKLEMARRFVGEIEKEVKEYGSGEAAFQTPHFLEFVAKRLWETLSEAMPGVDRADIVKLTGLKLLLPKAYIAAMEGIQSAIGKA